MRTKYHNRAQILQRLNQPGSPSISVISEETGVPKATLYAWLSQQRRQRAQDTPFQGKLLMTKRTKKRSPSVKMTLVSQSHGLKGDALQEFCNNKGVTVEELLSWRDLALCGIEQAQRDGLG